VTCCSRAELAGRGDSKKKERKEVRAVKFKFYTIDKWGIPRFGNTVEESRMKATEAGRD